HVRVRHPIRQYALFLAHLGDRCGLEGGERGDERDERDDEDPGHHPRAAAHGAQMGWGWRSGVRARPRHCRGCTRRLALAPAHAFTLALAPAHALAHVFAPALALAPAPT